MAENGVIRDVKEEAERPPHVWEGGSQATGERKMKRHAGMEEKGDSCTCCVASFADMTPAVLCGIADGQEGQALV